MISLDQKKVMMGNLGERIVSDVLREQGYDVQLSYDPFDNKKDFTVNGASVEVKTQVPFYSRNSFSVNITQRKKLSTVDFIVFIAVPSQALTKVTKTNYDGKIYAAKSSELLVKNYTTRDGRQMILIPINQEAMLHCHTITDINTLNHLRNLTSSKA
jgi:hypothetical protein